MNGRTARLLRQAVRHGDYRRAKRWYTRLPHREKTGADLHLHVMAKVRSELQAMCRRKRVLVRPDA